ncbi:MAG: YdeI/OmpD-associated family protein [Acidobacteriota bacterium]|nr:YdeI/OmpD-associated family protein [Acidobacteriota bacterium]
MAASRSPHREFRAPLERLGRALGWTIVRLPFAPAELGEMIRLRVCGELSGPSGTVAFRTSLFSFADGSGFFLPINREMQQGSGVRVGETAGFRLQADRAARPAELPDELAVLLDEEPELRAWYRLLSESMRREIGRWIQGVKSDAARLRRAEQMAERMILAMEGEREPPPVLERAFRSRPRARAGWSRLTPHQRRSELLAIFHYQTPEARERRVQKVCDLAETRAAAV